MQRAAAPQQAVDTQTYYRYKLERPVEIDGNQEFVIKLELTVAADSVADAPRIANEYWMQTVADMSAEENIFEALEPDARRFAAGTRTWRNARSVVADRAAVAHLDLHRGALVARDHRVKHDNDLFLLEPNATVPNGSVMNQLYKNDLQNVVTEEQARTLSGFVFKVEEPWRSGDAGYLNVSAVYVKNGKVLPEAQQPTIKIRKGFNYRGGFVRIAKLNIGGGSSIYPAAYDMRGIADLARPDDAEDGDVPAAFQCGATVDGSPMRDPVILIASGQTYERVTVERWLEDHNTDPLTNVSLGRNRAMIPNVAMRQAIADWLQGQADVAAADGAAVAAP
jgi:hypothetical protein